MYPYGQKNIKSKLRLVIHHLKKLYTQIPTMVQSVARWYTKLRHTTTQITTKAYNHNITVPLHETSKQHTTPHHTLHNTVPHNTTPYTITSCATLHYTHENTLHPQDDTKPPPDDITLLPTYDTTPPYTTHQTPPRHYHCTTQTLHQKNRPHDPNRHKTKKPHQITTPAHLVPSQTPRHHTTKYQHHNTTSTDLVPS